MGINNPALAAELGLDGGGLISYWQLEPTNDLSNPNTGWYFTCDGVGWNTCQQWNGYSSAANDEYLTAIVETAAEVPESILVQDFYCNSPNTPERHCTGLILTEAAMEAVMGSVTNVAYTSQSTTHVTFNFSPASHAFSDPEAAKARGGMQGDPPTARVIGILVDGDWERLDDASLLDAFAPAMRFSLGESYRPASAALATDTYSTESPAHANRLERDSVPIASADPDDEENEVPLANLSLSYLGDSAATDDVINEPEFGIYDEPTSALLDYAYMLDEHPDVYENKMYARIVPDPEESGDRILQYWFYYYYNPKTFYTVGNHEGDWEWLQIRVDEDWSYPVSVDT